MMYVADHSQHPKHVGRTAEKGGYAVGGAHDMIHGSGFGGRNH